MFRRPALPTVTLLTALAAALLLGCELDRVVLQTGSLRLLTYNVAGLPQGLSSSDPENNTPQISPLLNGYDLVCVQEDFWYHDALAKDARHPFRSIPQGFQFTFVNDGLNRFSASPFTLHRREIWETSFGLVDHGSDTLSAKGFSFARHEVAPGVEIDVYNHHADAGGDPRDVLARRKQFHQMALAIGVLSSDRAVVVVGDTNLGAGDPDDEPILLEFLAATGLADAGRTLGSPSDPIDRIFFRDGETVRVRPTAWRLATEFVTPAGGPLSDHDGVHVDLRWELLGVQ